MSILSQFFGNSSGSSSNVGVRRVIRGNTDLGATINPPNATSTKHTYTTGYTLTDITKASLNFSSSYTYQTDAIVDSVIIRGKILNETQIEFNRVGNRGWHNIDWEIIEYY